METKLTYLRLLRQGGTYREACFKENFKGCALLHHKFFAKKSGDVDAGSLKYFDALHASYSFCYIFCFLLCL
jgi:hypothetical protein